MKRKLVSERNPQGVEYPEAVTADGKLVSATDIEKGNEAWEEVKFYFPGCEGDDEEEMLFIQRKHKNGVTKFFRHRPGYIGGRNEPDRYLHNYAELRIKQRFDESLKSGDFPVQFYVIEQCPENSACKLKAKLKCNGEPKPVLNSLNLRKIYDTCSIEKGADKYIADLLLTNSQDDSIKPMFLEVFVTHKCTEEKIASGYPIIEIKINQKEDADNPIVENAGEVVDEYLFMQSENKIALPPIVFYGFKRKVPFNNYLNYGNFLLTKKDNELIADCRAIACKDIENFVPENRAFSLSVPLELLKGIDIYELGMAKALSMGLKMKDCSICNQYKRSFGRTSYYTTHPCRLNNVTYTYKDEKGFDWQIQNPYICQMPYRWNGFDKAKMAMSCQQFTLDRQRISEIVRLLEQKTKLLWIDESLLSSKPKPVEKAGEHSFPTNPKIYEQGRKLLTEHECLSCPIYRPTCGHRLGIEMKDGSKHVICDYQRPQSMITKFNYIL